MIFEMLQEYVMFDEMVTDVYESEQNFNNCDRTTGQRVYNQEEIKGLIDEVLNTLNGK